MAGFRSVCRPASRRNGGRLEIGIPGRLRRNTHLIIRLTSEASTETGSIIEAASSMDHSLARA